MRDFTPHYSRYVPAPNLSGGFHGVLLEYLRTFVPPGGKSLLLVAEPPEVVPIFEHLREWSRIDTLGYGGDRGQTFERDLNCRWDQLDGPRYDAVLCQAVLEHLCRPCVAVENLIGLLHPGGHLLLHTVMPGFPYHPFPIDCCRFFIDWFADLCRYIPATLEQYDYWDSHCCAVLRRKEAA